MHEQISAANVGRLRCDSGHSVMLAPTLACVISPPTLGENPQSGSERSGNTGSVIVLSGGIPDTWTGIWAPLHGFESRPVPCT